MHYVDASFEAHAHSRVASALGHRAAYGLVRIPRETSLKTRAHDIRCRVPTDRALLSGTEAQDTIVIHLDHDDDPPSSA